MPVWTEQGRGGGIALMPGYRTDMTGLTAAESRALVALTGRAVPSDLGMGSALASAVHKLVAAVPASHRAAAEQARQKVLVDHSGWYRRDPPAPHVETVQDAVWDDRRLWIRYRHGDGADTEAVLDPYGLVVKAGVWYLVAALRGTPGLWRVDRIREAKALDEPVQLSGEVDLASVWEALRADVERPKAEVAVRVRARVDVAPILLRVTTGQRSRDAEAPVPDGDGWVLLDLVFRAPGGAAGSLLGFGDAVEVLDPPEVREQLLSIARAALSVYAARSGQEPVQGSAPDDQGAPSAV